MPIGETIRVEGGWGDGKRRDKYTEQFAEKTFAQVFSIKVAPRIVPKAPKVSARLFDSVLRSLPSALTQDPSRFAIRPMPNDGGRNRTKRFAHIDRPPTYSATQNKYRADGATVGRICEKDADTVWIILDGARIRCASDRITENTLLAACQRAGTIAGFKATLDTISEKGKVQRVFKITRAGV